MRVEEKCPVTVLTGFLGSGKTTLLNALIRGRQDVRIAVIVNEFGELGIDAELIDSSEDEVIQLSNGCLCCTVRGDLLKACERLAARRAEFDWLVVETSGLADPAPIAQTFLLDDGPGETFRLDGIVTLVDAVNGFRNPAAAGLLARQIATADRLILTKSDAVTPDECDALAHRLTLLNSGAAIMRSSADAPRVEAIMGIGAYDLGALESHLCFVPAPSHDSSITSESFLFDSPFDFTAFSGFMKQLLATRGEDVLRVKGILDLAGEHRRFAFHGVQTLIDGDVIGPWNDEARKSRLVFIGRNLDRRALLEQLGRCLA